MLVSSPNLEKGPGGMIDDIVVMKCDEACKIRKRISLQLESGSFQLITNNCKKCIDVEKFSMS